MTETQRDALHKIDKAIDLLDKQLDKQPDPLLLFVPREQMVTFRQNLGQMRQMIADDETLLPESSPLDLARQVIYDWPHTALGVALVEAERAFYQAVRRAELE